MSADDCVNKTDCRDAPMPYCKGEHLKDFYCGEDEYVGEHLRKGF